MPILADEAATRERENLAMRTSDAKPRQFNTHYHYGKLLAGGQESVKPMAQDLQGMVNSDRAWIKMKMTGVISFFLKILRTLVNSEAVFEAKDIYTRFSSFSSGP